MDDADSNCPSCGHEVSIEHAYCPKCGRKIEQAPIVGPPTEPKVDRIDGNVKIIEELCNMVINNSGDKHPVSDLTGYNRDEIGVYLKVFRKTQQLQGHRRVGSFFDSFYSSGLEALLQLWYKGKLSDHAREHFDNESGLKITSFDGHLKLFDGKGNVLEPVWTWPKHGDGDYNIDIRKARDGVLVSWAKCRKCWAKGTELTYANQYQSQTCQGCIDVLASFRRHQIRGLKPDK